MEFSHPTILAKCCHDLDMLTSYADSECETISSIGELGFFKPENAPEDAADRCFECKHKDACPYSAKRIYIDAWHEKGEPEFAWPFNKVSLVKPMTEENLMEGIKTNDFGRCAFKQKVDVVDHQIVQMTFKNGIKATLKMVFAAERGRRITLYGTYGEIVLDERMDEIHVMPFGKEKQIIKISDLIEVDSGHGGGDTKIIDSLYEMLVSAEDGKTSLAKSVESHLMGIAAEESRKSGGVPVRVHE
jgi:predicted dehydrogenase